jgi:(p)ppGpp synthase/HD superfamily hydrolase
MTMVERARVFATAAHAAVGQKRKYTFEPYIVHPTEVASIVATVPHTDVMLAAAYLHDTEEDTCVTNEDIAREFGAEVAELVGWLTDVSKPEDGNRAVRKAIDREHTAMAPAEAQTVKVCDLLSNTKSIVAHDPEFARVYLAEKRELLAVLTKADPGILAEAYRVLDESERTLQLSK